MALQGREWRPREAALLLYNAGWKDANNLCIMVAVLLAESALYEQAWHWNDNGTTDWGLFQLNDGCNGGREPGAGGVVLDPKQKEFRDRAWNPQLAVLEARKLYEDRKFQPWAAYNSGAYKAFLSRACAGVANFLAIKNGIPPVV